MAERDFQERANGPGLVVGGDSLVGSGIQLHCREAGIPVEISSRRPATKGLPFDLRDRQLTDNFGRAAFQYRPQPWAGRAILFRAATANYIFSAGGLNYGWDKVIMGGIETMVISGNHDTLMLGANSLELMRHLNKAVEKACGLGGEQSNPVTAIAS